MSSLDRILCGDNRTLLRSLDAGSIDLAYLDPPFNTGRDFGSWKDVPSMQQEDVSTWPLHAQTLLERIVTTLEPRIASYLHDLGHTLAQVRRVVKPSGAIWIHVDERHAHYVRLIAEMLLVPATWQRTVIWRYRRWPTTARGYQRMHDTLFWFAGPGHTFHELYGLEPLADSTRKTFGTDKQLAARNELGNRISVRTKEVTKGPPLSDVWDVPVLAPSSLERRRGGKWPTQKPEALLERVILSTSSKGDVILDPCCGSGTTLAAAKRLGRRWIGMDCSSEACQIAELRTSLTTA